MIYEFSKVKETSEVDYGTLDVHGKNGEIKNIPSQFTLDFWIKCKFNSVLDTNKEIFGMYLYDDENANVSIYDSNIPNGTETELITNENITPYIKIYVDSKRNNSYIFKINNKEAVIEKYKINTEWNHVALVYDKLNNTSCIWYLNGNPILGSNIITDNMQEIVNKKFCRFLWTMYKNDNYVYIYKIHLIENEDAEHNYGIKYNKAFNIFNDNTSNNIANKYLQPILKPKPGHLNYENTIYLPMQNYETEQLGNVYYTFQPVRNYSPKTVYGLSDIVENNIYNKCSEIVELNNLKIDDRSAINVYGYDTDYRIDMGKAIALHSYSGLKSNSTIYWGNWSNGITIDWFKMITEDKISVLHLNEQPQSYDHNHWSKIGAHYYINQNNKENTVSQIYYTNSTFWNNKFSNMFKTGNSYGVSNHTISYYSNKNAKTIEPYWSSFYGNFFNIATTTSSTLKKQIFEDIRNMIYTNNDWDNNLNLFHPHNYFMVHCALVFKPGGKLLYYENGNKIDLDMDNIQFGNNNEYKTYFYWIPTFDCGSNYTYYPCTDYSSTLFYSMFGNSNVFNVKNYPNSYSKLIDAVNYAKQHKEEALYIYTHLDDYIDKNGTSYEQQAYNIAKYFREDNGKFSPINQKYYYNYYNFRFPNIFNHFRIAPGCLWYNESFDPLTDTRLFIQDYDNDKNTQKQIISDIDKDNIALLYPVQSPQTIYDRRYSISANARQSSELQKSNFQVEPLSTKNITYDTEITQQANSILVNYTNYPAIVTNTYEDNENVVIFRNHHIEDKSWTVDLWLYPKLQVSGDINNNTKLFYVSGYGVNGDTASNYWNTGNGCLGLNIINSNIISVTHSINYPWSIANTSETYNKLFKLHPQYVNVSPEARFPADILTNDNILHMNTWNHIALVSDINNCILSMYINGNKVYVENNRRFSYLHRLFLYTGSTDNWIKPYYTGLKVTVGEAKYTEDNISGWENC